MDYEYLGCRGVSNGPWVCGEGCQVTLPLNFDEIAKAEAAAAINAEKQRVMDSKRLIQYPIRVRKIKRLRRQISGLNRCIRDYNDYSLVLFNKLMRAEAIAAERLEGTINVSVVVGILCLFAGWLLG